MNRRLEGKVALVTSAGSGIGRASALAFAREGARVVVTDSSQSEGDGTARLIGDAGGEGLFVAADVTRADDVEALVVRTIQAFGRLDMAHNNGGPSGAPAPTAETTEENWDLVMDLNLKSIWLCMRSEIARMSGQAGGSIVNTASVAGLVAFPTLSAYVASKHGVLGLTKTAALEYGKAGIRVNAICPGTTYTPALEEQLRINPALEETMAAQMPLGRIASPEQVAEVAVWLCTDAAGYVNGIALPIDGGVTAQ